MMLISLSAEHIRTTMQLWRSAYEHKAILPDGSEMPMKRPQEILRQFMNVSRGWGDMMRASLPEAGKDEEFDDFFREILEFNSWAKEELVRIERSLEKEQSNQPAEKLPMMATLEESSKILENIPELQLLNPDEQVIAERYAAKCLAAAIERDKENSARPPVTEPPPSPATQRLLDSVPPFEEISAEQREWVRLVDALQSLQSQLYWAKKERLGIEQYLQKYTTSRVR